MSSRPAKGSVNSRRFRIGVSRTSSSTAVAPSGSGQSTTVEVGRAGIKRYNEESQARVSSNAPSYYCLLSFTHLRLWSALAEKQALDVLFGARDLQAEDLESGDQEQATTWGQDIEEGGGGNGFSYVGGELDDVAEQESDSSRYASPPHSQPMPSTSC